MLTRTGHKNVNTIYVYIYKSSYVYIRNQNEFCLGSFQLKNCKYNHIPFNKTRDKSSYFCFNLKIYAQNNLYLKLHPLYCSEREPHNRHVSNLLHIFFSTIFPITMLIFSRTSLKYCNYKHNMLKILLLYIHAS